MDWVNELNEQISEYLSSNKTVKFNTHNNRKAVIAKIKDMIKSSIEKNVPQLMEKATASPSNYTVINPEKPQDAKSPPVIVTKGDSEKGDAHREVNKRIRTW